jgi:hypothetical protein
MNKRCVWSQWVQELLIAEVWICDAGESFGARTGEMQGQSLIMWSEDIDVEQRLLIWKSGDEFGGSGGGKSGVLLMQEVFWLKGAEIYRLRDRGWGMRLMITGQV